MLMATHAMAAAADTHPRRAPNASVERTRSAGPKAGSARAAGSKFTATKGESKTGGLKMVASKSRRQRVQFASLRSQSPGAGDARGSDGDLVAAYDPDKAYDPERSGGSAVAGVAAPVQADVASASPSADEPARPGGHVFQTGLASWYGGRSWNGHRTSDGGQFSDAELTAAHATLPMGSLVRVTLSSSERSVVVRINDRPGTRRRIIDLSRAAAERLGILGSGVAMVTLSPI